jgi:hypothetical protein
MKYMNVVKRFGAKVAAPLAGLGSMLAAGVASAQSTLGSAAYSAVSGLQTDVNAVLIILVAVVFLIVAFSYLKKAR